MPRSGPYFPGAAGVVGGRLSYSKWEYAAIADVRDALGSSLELGEVMRAAQPPLLRLLGGDHTALGFAQPGNTVGTQALGRLEWIQSQGLPPDFFSEYQSWWAHDFVLKAVVRRPREVLTDSQMVARSALESNPIYHRARELGVPLQHVMAVMLDVDATISGLSIYRELPHPFGERERALLEQLTPALTAAVQNCLRFESAERRAGALERVVADRDLAVMLFDTGAQELYRSQRVTRLLERCFPGAPNSAPALPEPLASAVAHWLQRAHNATPSTFSPSGSTHVLVVTPQWIGESARVLLSLVMEERSKPPWPPEAWARLTPRQRVIVAAVVRGWDNQLIASELGCRPATVKTHLTQIYDKLGIGSRAKLMAAALAFDQSLGCATHEPNPVRVTALGPERRPSLR